MSSPSSAAPRRAVRPLLLALAASAIVTGSASAQQADEPVEVRGVVVDATSGSQVPGAAVQLVETDRRTISNRDGGFVLRDVRPDTYRVIVTQLGYDTLRTEVRVAPEGDALRLRLTPDPVVLERVTAMVDRFERQRNSLGFSVRVFDQTRLHSSTDYSALEFLERRSSLVLTRCPSRVAMTACAWVRGRPTEVQVYVDGARVVGGVEMLAAYRPEELYSIEVIAGGRAIRTYTNWFVETVARGRRLPEIFLF